MPIEGNLEYALARVHARQGRRLDTRDWHRLETTRDLGSYLATVRATAQCDWVGSFDPEDDCHTLERLLRVRWRRYVDDVASWHPSAFQAWIAWLRWLPELGLLAQLARPEQAPLWMLADPVYGPLAPGTRAERMAALADTALSPLAPVLLSGASAVAAWVEHWHALRPRLGGRTQSFLERLQDLHHASDRFEMPRSELAGRMQRLLRLGAGTVVVTLCHLALVALDVERLRGGLARRRLFGAIQSEHP